VRGVPPCCAWPTPILPFCTFACFHEVLARFSESPPKWNPSSQATPHSLQHRFTNGFWPDSRQADSDRHPEKCERPASLALGIHSRSAHVVSRGPKFSIPRPYASGNPCGSATAVPAMCVCAVRYFGPYWGRTGLRGVTHDDGQPNGKWERRGRLPIDIFG